MTSKDKLQHLLITHLLKEGQIELTLPNGLTVELGITKETKHGTQISDDYVWMTASQDDRIVSLDSYNLGLEFSRDRLVFDDEDAENHTLSVI
jgi:hypothetical protein